MFKLFKDKEFFKQVLQIALPIAMQNLLVASFALIDTIMVGQIGDVALSAVGMAGQWSRIMNMVVFGISSGSVVFIAQYWGNKDIDGIHRVVGIAISFAAVASVALMMIGFLAPEFVIRLFNSDKNVIASGVDYLKIAVFSYPAVAVNLMLSTALRTTERVKLPLVVSGITAVMNGIFNYALIFGKFGLPEMGVKGAALATCISAWAGPVLTLVISLAQHNILVAPLKKYFSFKLSNIRTYLKTALPVICNETGWGLGQMVFNIMLANLGYENCAALTIFRTFEEVSFVFFVGLCNASCVLVGKAIGAGDLDAGRTAAKRFSILVPALAVVEGALMILFRNQLVQLFNLTNNLSQYTVHIAALLIVVAAIEMPIRNIPYIQIVGIFRPGGDTKTAMKFDLMTTFLMSMPATAIAAYVLKLPFVAVFAIMLVFEDWVKTALCIKHFRSGKWIHPVTEEGRLALEREKEAQKAAVSPVE